MEDNHISQPAASLSRAAPREWEEFKTAFKKYAEGQRDSLMRASTEELQRAQGRAQACSALTMIFADAEKAAERASDRTVRPRN